MKFFIWNLLKTFLRRMIKIPQKIAILIFHMYNSDYVLHDVSAAR